MTKAAYNLRQAAMMDKEMWHIGLENVEIRKKAVLDLQTI